MHEPAGSSALTAPAAPGRPSRSAERWHKPVFIAFLLVWLLNWVLLLFGVQLPSGAGWVEGLFPLTTCATTLVALGRRLPLQNVLTAAVLIAGLGSILTGVGIWTGVPFGPVFYTNAMGEKIGGMLPWPTPFLWVILIINGRGVARLIMRPWRRTNYYGYWVIGFTCLLVVLFDLGFEPMAVKVKGYWVWLSANSILSWHTAPWASFLGLFVSVLGILAFTIPWLINKQPIKQPRDYHPLIVWVLINVWVATGNALHGLWSAAILATLGQAIATIYAIRGARW